MNEIKVPRDLQKEKLLKFQNLLENTELDEEKIREITQELSEGE